MYRNVYLIFNPNAGKLVKNPGLVQRVQAILESGGINARLTPTAAPGHATELAAQAVADGADLVIAMGGDGTVNEVLNGMANQKVPLAVIPAGTANVFCCETGIPRQPEKAARLLPEWVEATVALGWLRFVKGPSRYFLCMAGAGFDAAIVQRVEPSVKRRLGKLAYWSAGFAAFGEKLAILRARADGEERLTGFALTSRVRNYGGDLSIATKASLFADRFELVTFNGRSTIPYTIYLAGAAIACATRMPGVNSLLTRKVELTAENGATVYIQADGEAAGQLPVTIEIAPAALTVLVPPQARK